MSSIDLLNVVLRAYMHDTKFCASSRASYEPTYIYFSFYVHLQYSVPWFIALCMQHLRVRHKPKWKAARWASTGTATVYKHEIILDL